MNTWYWRWDKLISVKFLMLGDDLSAWDFQSSMTFPWLLMIFQSSMTFHDFSRKFYFSRFSRFSRPCGNPDPYTWPWSPNGHGHGHEWPTATPFVQCQSALPFWDTAISKFDHENPWSSSCVWSKVQVTFDLQNSKVKVMVKPTDHIWGLEFNRYVCFLFRGNRTTFGWYSKFHIWPWIFEVKVIAKVKPDGHIWGLEFNRYICFSFRGNRAIFGWDIANSIFDLENSRSRSRLKLTKI